MPHIRPYRPGDWDAYLELDLETGLTIVQGSAEDQARFRERWPAVLKSQFGWSDSGPAPAKGTLWVLEAEDGDYAGHLWLTEQEDLFTGDAKLFVTTVALRAKYRGRGWGRLLLQYAVDRARTRGISLMGLAVHPSNTGAIRLYEQFGFETTRLSMERLLDRDGPESA